jgi:hypothetical protein
MMWWKTLVSMRKFFVGLLVVGCFIVLFITTLGRTLDFAFSGNTLCAIINGEITAIFFALILVAGFIACQLEDKEPPPARNNEGFIREREIFLRKYYGLLERRLRHLPRC